MAFFKDLKESKRARRIMQFVILLVVFVVELFVNSQSFSPQLTVGISFLAIVLGAFLIFTLSDFWQTRRMKKSRKRLEEDSKKSVAKDLQRTEEQSQVNSNKISAFLPSFSNMEKDATAEEVMRVAALTQTILNLTFKNPFPIADDPVFSAVFKVNKEWADEQMANGKYTIEAHEELKEAYTVKYSEPIAKQMMEIDYWNQRMIEHAVLTRTLGPKPAFQCLQTALNLRSLFQIQAKEALDLRETVCEAIDILVVNYAHLLLKSTTLPMQNPALVDDICKELKQTSAFLHFDEGMKYVPQARVMREVGDKASNAAKPDVPSTETKDGRGKLMRPKFSKEETLALGTVALSFIVRDGRPDEKAEPVIINELEGCGLEDVKHMYIDLMKEQGRLAMLLHNSCMFDPFKKMYATGFLAKAIHSRSDGGKAPMVEEAWKKVVRNIFGFAGDGTESIEAGVKLYDQFEHPKIEPDTLFLILSWLSQVNYK